ncbi:hypothetical protein SCUCBS95973_004885 [Sporothrix curviconia]|uniref:Kinase n=1 Tax=Sporothrix curviconia TaxID=1260050 RepID=A0ABP0BS69_9PEZI
MPRREIPKPSELRAFDEAVAGHAGTLCDADGYLFIKPCVQAEIDFYQQVFDGCHPALADIMPLFMGSLMLNDGGDTPVGGVGSVPLEAQKAMTNFVQSQQPSQDQSQQSQQSQQPQQPQQPQQQSHQQAQPQPQAQPLALASTSTATTTEAPVDNVTWVPRGSQSIKTDRAIVLDNATHGFQKPNVLDVKLGRRLWGDSAPLQKRQRMEEVSRQTTHGTHGFRIAGMRVYEGPEKGYRIYDKDYGRKDINDDNVADAFRKFLCNPSAGVDAEHSRAIAQAFKTDLERVRDVLQQERTRMYSSSLLFVYEGDGEALRAAVAEGNAKAEMDEQMDDDEEERGAAQVVALGGVPIRVIEAEATYEEPDSTETELAVSAMDGDDATLRARSRREVLGKGGDRSSSRTDSGIVIDDDDDDTLQNDVQVDIDFVEGDDGFLGDAGDDSDNDSEMSTMPRIYSLRLIDFAHARFVAREDGPDENNLPGVRRLIEIFEELAK